MATNFNGILTSRVSPAFLHGNSTSHTWPFSAIAELIDNAYDPDVSASELWIDKRNIGDTECLTFVDNGNGMNQEKLHKMLSFGYCDKVAVGNVQPIGYYGNGFKSGSMRLGKDAMVFTRSLNSSSIGFLSQSYLSAVGADAVVVPIVTWQLQGGGMVRKKSADSDSNLKAILQYSVFKTEKSLVQELKSLERMRTGTNIIIYNLKKDKSGNLELDFSSDLTDIRNPETPVIDLTTINRPVYTSSPEYRRSLREYCSILYLKPRMKIVLRGQKVKTKLISKSLSQTERDVYKPTWLNQPVKMTFGFTNNTEADSYGLMMYHKNRLIRAYEKIGCQKQANDHGVGVLGVVEVNFLDPVHNKQEFNRTDKYLAFMQNAGTKLNDYYFEKTQNKKPNQTGEPSTSQPASQLPDWTWAQCDNCLSWRRLPTDYTQKLPEKWYCYLNPDAHFNRCDIAEEPEDDDEALQPTYIKTYKKTLEEKKRNARAEEERKIREKEALLKKKEFILEKKAKEISRQQEELETVSSSQDKSRPDRKPTVADLEKAKKNLQEYQVKMKIQQETIEQLETQKRQIEQKSQAMLRMAESLKVTNSQSKTLVEKVETMAGGDNSAVSSSSHTLRAPTKRKGSTDDGSGDRVTKIKTEDGGHINITPIKNGEKLIDLTLDEDDLAAVGADNDSATTVDNTPVKTQDTSVKSKHKTSKKSDKSLDKSKPQSPSDKIAEKRSDKEKSGSSSSETDKKSDKDQSKDKSKSDKSKVSAKDTETPMETEASGNQYTEMNNDDVKPDKTTLDKQLAEGTSEVVEKSISKKDKTKKSKTDEQSTSKEDTEETKAEDEKPAEIKDDKDSVVKENKDSVVKDDKDTDTVVKDTGSVVKDDKDSVVKSEVKKEVIDSSAQTVPVVVKFASPEEVELLNLSPIDQKQMLLQKARELDESSKRLTSLQGNIWQLLKIIVSDFDYGEPENIENIILDFLRVNGEQPDQNGEQPDQSSSTSTE